MYKVMFEDFRDDRGPYVHSTHETLTAALAEFDILSDLYAWEDYANFYIEDPA